MPVLQTILHHAANTSRLCRMQCRTSSNGEPDTCLREAPCRSRAQRPSRSPILCTTVRSKQMRNKPQCSVRCPVTERSDKHPPPPLVSTQPHSTSTRTPQKNTDTRQPYTRGRAPPTPPPSTWPLPQNLPTHKRMRSSSEKRHPRAHTAAAYTQRAARAQQGSPARHLHACAALPPPCAPPRRMSRQARAMAAVSQRTHVPSPWEDGSYTNISTAGRSHALPGMRPPAPCAAPARTRWFGSLQESSTGALNRFMRSSICCAVPRWYTTVNISLSLSYVATVAL